MLFASRTNSHSISRTPARSGSDAPLLRRVMAHSRLYNDRMHTNLLRKSSLRQFPAIPECGHSVRGHVVFPNPELARWLRLIHAGCPNCVACVDE
jgi:hypothetical protein